MWRASKFIVMASLIFAVKNGYADHPNEGSMTLEALIQEALANNPELEEVSQNKIAAKFSERAEKGAAFSPELSLEGGPLSNKYDSEKSSGTTVYGKAEWNLYKGGKDRANIQKARLGTMLSEKQALATSARIEREVARVYYEMLFLLESISIKEKAAQLNLEQMKLAKVKKASGFTSSADVIEFELREATLNADLKRLNLEKEEKSRELSLLLGRSESAPNLSVKGHLAKGALGADTSSILKRVQDTNPEIVEAQIQRDIGVEERAIARSSFLPRVDLEGKYGKLADETRIYDEKNNYSVMMKVNIPLLSGFSTVNQVGAAGARVSAQEAALTRKKLTAATAANGLYAQLGSILERLDLEEKTLARSEEYYKITTGEYRRGIKNSPDMVGAAEKLLDAKIRNLEYRRDFYLTKIKLLGLAGMGVEKNASR